MLVESAVYDLVESDLEHAVPHGNPMWPDHLDGERHPTREAGEIGHQQELRPLVVNLDERLPDPSPPDQPGRSQVGGDLRVGGGQPLP